MPTPLLSPVHSRRGWRRRSWSRVLIASVTSTVGALTVSASPATAHTALREATGRVDVAVSPAKVVAATQRPRVHVRAGWRINRRNVGLHRVGLSCDSLPVYRGPSKPPRGTVIRKRLVTVPLDLSNGRIKVVRSCIRPTTTGYHNQFLVTTTTCAADCWATGAGHVVIRDSEISGLGMTADRIASSCAFLGVGRLVRNYIHGMGSGICFFETGTQHNALALNNYVTGLRSYGSSHNEAATIRDFRRNARNTRRAAFVGNRLDCEVDNVTGGLFIQPTWQDIYNVIVRRNLFEGGGYNLFVTGGDGSYGNIRAVNNRFLSTGWGPSAVTAPPGWQVWRDNHMFAPGAKGARGAVVRPS